MKKKFVKKANAWMVSWTEHKDRKVVEHKEWFIHEVDAQNFINEKNEKI